MSATALAGRMWAALGGPPDGAAEIRFHGRGALPAPFAMTDLGAAAVAAAGAAVAELVAAAGGPGGQVEVDRVLATGWFHRPSALLVARDPRRSPFHAMSRDFPTADGRFLRFQANYPHLRAAALGALGVDADGVAAVVRAHPADELEATVVAAGGAAAATRTVEQWRDHPQGAAVAREPLVEVEEAACGPARPWEPLPVRPLAGLRVLDLTRVLAGPVATRFLAAYGAEVLRIDPPGYAEPTGTGTGDLTLGKRCAWLDLRTRDGRDRFVALLADADVLVHGLRPGALDGLGLGRPVRAATRPDLVEVTLDAYGWTGPWRTRRGFDTLVQASCGIALAGGDAPQRFPLSILDHATGYLMAAAAVRGVTGRLRGRGGSVWRTSLAATAALLVSAGAGPAEPALDLPVPGPVAAGVHASPLGPVRRLAWPLAVPGAAFGWDRPGDPYGTATAEWISGSRT